MGVIISPTHFERVGHHFFFNVLRIIDLYVVLVSSVQQSESVIHVTTLFLKFFAHIGHYRVLSRVPCAAQQVLTSYLFYV